MKVTVLGAGSWGTTLALVLLGNGHDVVLWSYTQQQAELMRKPHENSEFLPGIPLPPSLRISTDLIACSEDREMIVSAVPAQYLRSVIEKIAQLDLGHTVICNVAKGIENSTLMTMSE